MRKLSLLAICLCTGILAHAQNKKSQSSGSDPVFGIKGSFILSSEATTSSSKGNGSINSTSGQLAGFSTGIFAAVPLGGGIFISPELVYTIKGAKYTGANQFYSYAYKDNLGYINLPLLLKFKPSQAAGLNIYAGPEFGYLVSAKDKSSGSIGPYSGSSESNVYKNFKPFDLDLDFGLGFDFSRNVGIDARYSLGLVNISKNYGSGTINNNTSLKNRSFEFGLRYSF